MIRISLILNGFLLEEQNRDAQRSYTTRDGVCCVWGRVDGRVSEGSLDMRTAECSWGDRLLVNFPKCTWKAWHDSDAKVMKSASVVKFAPSFAEYWEIGWEELSTTRRLWSDMCTEDAHEAWLLLVYPTWGVWWAVLTSWLPMLE